jgi:hypothetical protein
VNFLAAYIEPDSWDFLTLVAGWNLFGLPAALVVLALVALIPRFRRLPLALASEVSETLQSIGGKWRIRTIQTVALIHLGLGLRAGIGLAQELFTLREQGILQSFPVTGLFIPAISVITNLAIGHGLWRQRLWALRLAIAWDAVSSVASAFVAFWQWKYRSAVRIDQWPDYFVADILPWFLLVLMLLPGTWSLFRRRQDSRRVGASAEEPCGKQAQWLVWLLALLCLVIVGSTLLVDAAGWLIRVLGEQL